MNDNGYGELITMFEDSGIAELTDDSDARMTRLQIAEINVKDQVRKDFEDDENTLRDLADDIAAQGVIQPITVRPNPHGNGYELVAGERRLRASKMAGLDRIPAVIRELSDDEAARVQMAENIHRKNLTQLEEAKQLKADLDRLGGDTDALIRRYNKKQSWLSKRLSILDLGPSASRLVGQNMTADIELIYGAKGLEKKAPHLAEEFVEELANATADTSSGRIRERLKEFKDRANKEAIKGTTGKPRKKAFKPKPATMPNPTRKTQPLHTFYQMVIRKKLSGKEALERMDEEDRNALFGMVDHNFNLGNASEAPADDLVEYMRSGDMAGGAAILILPFLLGAIQSEDDHPASILTRISGQKAGKNEEGGGE